MKLKYRNGGRPDMDVKSLLSALGEDDKRGLNKLLNKQNRIDLANDEEEGYADLKTERKKRRAERKLLNQEYRDEMKSDDPGMEEGEEESGGGMGKEDWRKILQAIIAGGTGFGAMVGIPKLFNLLKGENPVVESDALYHNVLDPRPDYVNRRLTRTPNKLFGGKNQ
tara:strand:- start:246 stop:746 length:501 start_codon:yes stop_codon:yes gene_type:complete